ncbi:cardiolipin synthase [Shimia aestuarii]|uniref:Cardiolipin synthase n=1 Tax=Shimia aestuarii TaxID=254406 RepID=A0A1I4T184_9RHOB|nr:cardiolipin synthase [Shimia aestuarii]SFM70484.1 cardiolipin synthase [Shimia aestuarii]
MATFFVIFVLLVESVAVWFAFRAMSGSRTPQGAVAWVVFLIAAPYVAIVSYLFLGHSRINGYVVARREYQEVVTAIEQARTAFPPKPDELNRGYKAFETIAENPILSGNSGEILVDGEESFEAMFDAIDAATSYILVQFYIVRDDQLGRKLKTHLIAAQNRGLRVFFLYDSVGCSRLPKAYVQELSELGIRIYDTNALRGPTKRFQLNFRNHRKTLVVDGTVGFTGGLNVGDEYMGRDPAFGDWRDTHCRLQGPVVLQLQLAFCEDWHWATQEYLYDQLDWPRIAVPENSDALLLTSGPADALETGNLYFNAMIVAARSRIWIASPYFVPDPDVTTALKLAALRGIEVRILVPARADHWITWLAAFAYFDELRDAGVEFWAYEQGFMHQKVVLVDDAIASVGTLNLDSRSCRLNFEETAIFFDSHLAEDLEIILKDDFARSIPLTKPMSEQPTWVRLMAPVARLFAPLL